MAYHQPFQITGFHSCDKKIGLQVLNGKIDLLPSDKKWDWLGKGIYFWEQNPQRAFEYATKCATGEQKFSGKIETPFVIGAIIELGNCLNLVEPRSLQIVKEAFNGLEKTFKETGKKMPKNDGANRQLDCAEIRYLHETRRINKYLEYDTIRSPYQEGGKLYHGATFTSHLHIEISVLNPEAIKG
ncbi:MAG: hypothetical protein ABIN25_00865 [Ginsengibacter sp.]